MNDGSKPNDQQSIGDIFWRSDLYPEAAALLSFAHLPIPQVKDSAIIVLDANVLLQPYEVESKELGNEIERVYRLLATEKRLIVPSQAVREYATIRPKKIWAMVKRLEASISKLNAPLLDKEPLLENDDRFLAIRDALKNDSASRREAIRLLQALLADVKADAAGDRIAVLYRDVLASCVVDPTYSSEQRKEIIKDLNRRQRLKLGPGLSDQRKDDQGIGDLLIWREILAQGKRRNTHCLFVSQETKDDWWAPDGGKFQLRPELVDEYRRESGGNCIHMVPLSALLTLFDADPSTVSDVADAEAREVGLSAQVFASQAARRNVDRRIAIMAQMDSLGALLEEKQSALASAEHKLATLKEFNDKSTMTKEQRLEWAIYLGRSEILVASLRHDITGIESRHLSLIAEFDDLSAHEARGMILE